MAKIGGFDPSVGITPFTDGYDEIGRTNLPASMRVIPESTPGTGAAALIYGKLSDSALMERFAAYLAPNIRHRELLAPEVFFEALAEAARAFGQSAGEQPGQPGEGPLAEAARALQQLLADRDLCEMLRNLVLKA
ncbi:MAG: hypothetical protein FWG74_02665 [Planctomycetes bacterium]|nr:hypothetical protein [Planctomycetota bacterium]